MFSQLLLLALVAAASLANEDTAMEEAAAANAAAGAAAGAAKAAAKASEPVVFKHKSK